MVSRRVDDAATVLLDETGKVEAASAAALELLGTTLAALMAAPRGAFAAQPAPADEEAALRVEWEARGRPELAGEATVKRADGRELRVRYLIARRNDGRFDVVLEPTFGPEDAPASVFALGEVLGEWRAAERRLAELSPDSPDWAAVSGEIARLRATYQAGYRARRRT